MEKRFKLAQQLRRESLKQELAAGLAGRQKANSNAAEGASAPGRSCRQVADGTFPTRRWAPPTEHRRPQQTEKGTEAEPDVLGEERRAEEVPHTLLDWKSHVRSAPPSGFEPPGLEEQLLSCPTSRPRRPLTQTGSNG